MEKDTINMIVIGKTGHGKSATCNSIICKENVFHSEVSTTSVTSKCVRETAVLGDKVVSVIDTPGTMDTDNTGAALEELGSVIYLCSEGVDALVVVLNSYVRITNEEKEALRELKRIFGAEFFENYGLFIFTHGDSFTKEKFAKHIQQQTGFMKDLLEECSYRALIFNNELSPEESTVQSSELLSMIESMQKKNKKRYSNEHFERARREREEEERKYREEKERLEREKRKHEDMLKAAAEKAEREKQALAEKRRTEILNVVQSEIDRFSKEWGQYDVVVNDTITNVRHVLLNNREREKHFERQLQNSMESMLHNSTDCTDETYKKLNDEVSDILQDKVHIFKEKMGCLITDEDTFSQKLREELSSFEGKWLQQQDELLQNQEKEWRRTKETMKFEEHMKLKLELESTVNTLKDFSEKETENQLEKKRKTFRKNLEDLYEKELEILKSQTKNILEFGDNWISKLDSILSDCKTKMTSLRDRELQELQQDTENMVRKMVTDLNKRAQRTFEEILATSRHDKESKLHQLLSETKKEIITKRACREQDLEAVYVAEKVDKWEAEFDAALVERLKEKSDKMLLKKFKHESRDYRDSIDDETWKFEIPLGTSLKSSLESTKETTMDDWKKKATDHYDQQYKSRLEKEVKSDCFQDEKFQEVLNDKTSNMQKKWSETIKETSSTYSTNLKNYIEEKIKKIPKHKDKVLTELDAFEKGWLKLCNAELKTHEEIWIKTYQDMVSQAGYIPWNKDKTVEKMAKYQKDMTDVIDVDLQKWKKVANEVIEVPIKKFGIDMKLCETQAKEHFKKSRKDIREYAEDEFDKELQIAYKSLAKRWKTHCRALRTDQKSSWTKLKLSIIDDTSSIESKRREQEQEWKADIESLMKEVIDECAVALSAKYHDIQVSASAKLLEERMARNKEVERVHEDVVQSCCQHFSDELQKQEPKVQTFSECFPEAETKLKILATEREEDFDKLLKNLQEIRTHKENVWLSKFKIKRTEAERKAKEEVCKKLFGKAFAELLACFPSSSTVQTETGEVSMSCLTTDQKVLCMSSDGKATFSKVYLFVHRDNFSEVVYRQISLNKAQLSISPNHYCIVVGVDGKDAHVLAKNVQIGDKMHVYDETTRGIEVQTVVKTKLSIEKGIFAPYTLTGNIVVNGVLASCYVYDPIFPPTTVHRMLSPIRSIYRFAPRTVARLSDVNKNGVLKWKRLIGKTKDHHRVVDVEDDEMDQSVDV